MLSHHWPDSQNSNVEYWNHCLLIFMYDQLFEPAVWYRSVERSVVEQSSCSQFPKCNWLFPNLLKSPVSVFYTNPVLWNLNEDQMYHPILCQQCLSGLVVGRRKVNSLPCILVRWRSNRISRRYNRQICTLRVTELDCVIASELLCSRKYFSSYWWSFLF